MLTIDPEQRKVFINNIEVVDPIIIGQSVLDDLRLREVSKADVIQRFKAYCCKNKNKHGHSIPITEERLKILNIILEVGGIFSASEVLKKIPLNFSISRATVYGTLKFFEKIGVIEISVLRRKGNETRKCYLIKNENNDRKNF